MGQSALHLPAHHNHLDACYSGGFEPRPQLLMAASIHCYGPLGRSRSPSWLLGWCLGSVPLDRHMTADARSHDLSPRTRGPGSEAWSMPATKVFR